MRLSILVTGLAASGFEKLDRYDVKSGLDAHNYYRGIHGVPPLEWDDELAKDAQVQCDRMAEDGVFEHARDLQQLGQGENLSMYFSPTHLNISDNVKVRSSAELRKQLLGLV